jgi:hypothetical protein
LSPGNHPAVCMRFIPGEWALNGFLLSRDMLKSPVFRSLNRVAMLVLLDFYSKTRGKYVKMAGGLKVWMYLNNGELQYSYKTALENGISRRDFARAIDALVSHGFLDIAHQGSGGRIRDASLYAVSERWRKWGKSEFDPGQARPKDTRKGRGFSVMWQKRREMENAIFGITGDTGMSITDDTRKSHFEADFDVSSNKNDTPKKARKRRKRASALH